MYHNLTLFNIRSIKDDKLAKVLKSRLFSITELSKITGRDRATISGRLQDMKPAKKDGRAKYYDSQEALPVIYAAESFKGMQKKIEAVGYEIEKEKLSKIRIQNEKESGKLVPIEDVCKTVEKEYTFVKAQMKSIPSKVSKPLSMESDPAVINGMLTDSINECLTELLADETYKDYLKELKEDESTTGTNTASGSTTTKQEEDSNSTTKTESS